MNLQEYEEMNRRAQDEAQRRHEQLMADIRRRNELQQARNEAMRQEHHGHGGTVLLLILAACILSHRLRFGLGVCVLILAFVAVIAGAVAMIGGSQDANTVTVIVGALALGGGLLWAIASLGAAVLHVVASDVRRRRPVMLHNSFPLRI